VLQVSSLVKQPFNNVILQLIQTVINLSTAHGV